MDFDFDSFYEVEKAINAIFNGAPLFPDPKGAQMLPPIWSGQGSQNTPTLTPTPTPTSTSSSIPKYPLGKTIRSESSPSLPAQSVDDAHKHVRSEDRTPLPKLNKTPSVYTDNSGQLYLAPDLDMSVAIALSQTLQKNDKRPYETAFGNDDSSVPFPRHMSVDMASQLPEKHLRDELVKLYFTHFHPLCPVIDEVEFMEMYNDIENDNELKKRIPLTLFQAMMHVAFGHLPSERLPSTPFTSIYEGQKAFLEKASLLYRLGYTKDHLVLTKVALLLTYWSPFDGACQVNNYWTDQGFYHARAITLWGHQGESIATSRRYRLIWWCCLLRDRLVSTALRRPYRIHEVKSTWPIVREADFGLEVMFPKFMTVKTKRTMIDSFIWLCKLSDIIRDIAVFHEKSRFDREWCGSLISSAAVITEASQVSQFDGQLRNWKEEYLEVNSEYLNSSRPGSPKMPCYVLIICDSVLTALYVPYIHCPPGSSQIVQRLQKIALQRIKIASSAIALHCYHVNQVSKVGEEFTVGIIAWIALPMGVFKVFEEKDGNPSNETSGRGYKDFVSFLSALAERFHPAKLLADTMCEAISQFVEKSTKLGIARKDVRHRALDLCSQKSSNVADASKNAAKESGSEAVEEAEILNCVSKIIDLRFSTNS